MTFIRRKTHPNNVVSEASEMIREGRALEAIDLLCFALRSEPANPTYYWLRGRAHWNLAFPDADPDRYRQALRDFEEAATMDPSMILNHGSPWPEQEWALPAYKQLLAHSDRNVREKAAKLIGVIGSEDPTIAEALFDAMRLNYNFWPTSICPIRRVVRSLGWPVTTQDGRDIVTGEEEVRRVVPDPPPASPADVKSRPVHAMLDDPKLYDKEDDEEYISSFVKAEIEIDDRTLLTRLDDRRPLVRAGAVAILVSRRPPDLFEKIRTCLRDRHRCVRAMALHGVVATATFAEPRRSAIECLAEAAQRDVAYSCRAIAVEAIGRVIAGLTRNEGDLLESLLEVLANRLADKNKNIVGRAVVAIGIAGAAAKRLLKYIDEIDFSENGEYTEIGVEWTCQKAKTVFLISKPGDPLRNKNWDVLLLGLRSPNCYFRQITAKHVGFFAMNDALIRPTAIKYLVERAMMDDYKIVRELARDTLLSLADNPLAFAKLGNGKPHKDR